MEAESQLEFNRCYNHDDDDNVPVKKKQTIRGVHGSGPNQSASLKGPSQSLK